MFGFQRFISFDDKDISTEYSALMSIVMSDDSHSVKFPINEPAAGRHKSQIQEYLDCNSGPGVQHVALACKDVADAVTKLRANGIEFLTVPDSYYDMLPERVGDILTKDLEQKVRELGILVDKDEEGHLLQIFTKPVEDRPTLFYEIIAAAVVSAKGISRRCLNRLSGNRRCGAICSQHQKQIPQG